MIEMELETNMLRGVYFFCAREYGKNGGPHRNDGLDGTSSIRSGQVCTPRM